MVVVVGYVGCYAVYKWQTWISSGIVDRMESSAIARERCDSIQILLTALSEKYKTLNDEKVFLERKIYEAEQMKRTQRRHYNVACKKQQSPW